MMKRVESRTSRYAVAALILSLFFSVLIPITAYAKDNSADYDNSQTLPESVTCNMVLVDSGHGKGISPLDTFTGSAGTVKLDHLYGSTIRWQILPNGPAGQQFAFAGTIYVDKFNSSSRSYKLYQTVPASGVGTYGEGLSNQVNLGLPKGSYRIDLYGTAIGLGGIATVLPDAVIGFTI